jgi:hypothetical protein
LVFHLTYTMMHGSTKLKPHTGYENNLAAKVCKSERALEKVSRNP